ncbi:MAG: hypothetical protein F4093_02490, partial [Gammaproteobacteria bacterium]|nr:hypothetical protein [Gammaproteobacteria bacterium]
MKPLNDLSVEDSGDMCAKLNQIDVTIPPRTQGRTSQHREARVARDFLEVISDTDLLNYPLHIRHQDRPDFLLSSQGRTTGIEITVCEHPDASRADAYSENKGLSGIQGVPSYRIGEQRSRKEIRAIATGNANIYPAMGREWEDNWIDAIVD